MNFIRKGDHPHLAEKEIVNPDGTRLPVLYFPLLERDGIAEHFFTTRLGGVSEGFLSSLNFRMNCGDSTENVQENFHRVAEAFGTDENHFILGVQTHGANVIRVGKEDGGMGLTKKAGGREGWESVDGMVTDDPGLVLGIFTADCVPILFIDPVHRAIGACHSGWRGTVSRIGERTVRKMQQEFGSDPADLLAGIGPSICRDHYEVSEEVADHFREEFRGHEEEILFYEGNPGHEQLDLWAACRITLKEAGVPKENIRTTDICTACNPTLLFSHRATAGKRGNIGSFIMLKEQIKAV